MKYLIANWKAQMTFAQTTQWCNDFATKLKQDTTLTNKLQANEISLIICPPFPFLSFVKEQFQNLGIKIGAQTISSYESGKYTGEVTAQALQGLVDFAIVGHSERRSHFQESNNDIEKKIMLARQYSIEPVLCVRDQKDITTQSTNFIAYEPDEAIGTGNNASLEQVLTFKKQLNLPQKTHFLYGGSVNEKNADMYLNNSEIDGLLIGTASLDPQQFFSIAKLIA